MNLNYSPSLNAIVHAYINQTIDNLNGPTWVTLDNIARLKSVWTILYSAVEDKFYIKEVSKPEEALNLQHSFKSEEIAKEFLEILEEALIPFRKIPERIDFELVPGSEIELA